MNFDFQMALLLALIFLVAYGIGRQNALIRFERRLRKNIKIYSRAFIFATQAALAERKKDMFVIVKAPGRVPERKHNVANTFKAIYREIDAENPNSIEIMPNVYMCYDTDGFAKLAAPCMTDERATNIYYGDVVFYAKNLKETAPRCLTEREAKAILEYITENRADKQAF